MKKRVLLIVPNTLAVREMDVFAGLRVVVLDDMLMSGFAGVYFRRLMVQGFLDPVKRVDYERNRREYLSRVLAQKDFPDGTVFIGTRATDVDLLDFSVVHTVRVSDKGLRKMSRVVYGDPVLLYMDYMAVLAAVEEAVDDVLAVVEWAEVPLLVMRRFPGRKDVDVLVQSSRQKAVLSEVLSGDSDAQVWLEDSVYMAGTEKRTLFMADYDYLSFVRPTWRDAVVRLLGKAPLVTEVFRLPWCVVDSAALTSLCYRPNIHGAPTASARGHSLIEFVHTRLAGTLTAREMVGTWVGGLLCDDVTAVDTIDALGDRSIAPSGDILPDRSSRFGASVSVPVEFAWMYSAVAGVSVRSWDGDRNLDGTPRVDSGDTGWAETLPFAELYAGYSGDVVMSASVVQFLSRLHGVSLPRQFMHDLLRHARVVLADGCTRSNFDVVMTPMLPGYNYLAVFSPSTRLSAAQVLGCSPGVVAALAYAASVSVVDGHVSPDELFADLARDIIFSGCYVVDFGRVGDTKAKPGGRLAYRPGFCYECLFQPRFRKKIRKLLGPYPTFKSLMHWQYIPWYIDNALDRVRVTTGRLVSFGGGSTTVMHLAIGGEGVSLRVCLKTSGSVWTPSPSLSAVRVGQNGVCYSSSWYVSAIIAWTVVGCVVFGILVFFAYKRCAGGRSGGVRGGNRFY